MSQLDAYSELFGVKSNQRFKVGSCLLAPSSRITIRYEYTRLNWARILASISLLVVCPRRNAAKKRARRQRVVFLSTLTEEGGRIVVL